MYCCFLYTKWEALSRGKTGAILTVFTAYETGSKVLAYISN